MMRLFFMQAYMKNIMIVWITTQYISTQAELEKKCSLFFVIR
jgi:hypothetical protein